MQSETRKGGSDRTGYADDGSYSDNSACEHAGVEGNTGLADFVGYTDCCDRSDCNGDAPQPPSTAAVFAGRLSSKSARENPERPGRTGLILRRHH